MLAEATIENPSHQLQAAREFSWRMDFMNGHVVNSPEDHFRLEAGREVVRVLKVAEPYLREGLDTCREFSRFDALQPTSSS